MIEENIRRAVFWKQQQHETSKKQNFKETPVSWVIWKQIRVFEKQSYADPEMQHVVSKKNEKKNANSIDMNCLVLRMRWSRRRTECAFIVTFAVIVTTVLYFAGRINQTWKTKQAKNCT